VAPVVPLMTRLRILWLCHFVPFPPKGGNRQRTYNLIAQVGRRHDVDLILLRPKPATEQDADEVVREAFLRHCRRVTLIDLSAATRPAALAWLALRSTLTAQSVTVTLFRSATARRLLRAALPEVDVVHLDSISLADYIDDTAPKPTMMTHHGAESFMIRRRIHREPSLLRKAFFAIEWLTLRRAERRALPRVALNIACSELDCRLMGADTPARYAVVDNGVDIGYFQPLPVLGGRSLLFAGRLDQYSNRDAILHFVDATWPLVIARYPDARLTIVGSNPPDRLRQLAAADARVTVTGFVDDVRSYFAEATAAICPIRDGGGTRIKVLDALAQGKPLVSTSIGAEGLELVPERDLLIGDTPEAFARQIGRVFDDDALRASLARQARAIVEQRYSWDRLGATMAGLCEDVATRSHP
jgi:glycosyltransferase involved in cell wall biosynthesis